MNKQIDWKSEIAPVLKYFITKRNRGVEVKLHL
jgi:hypothetical protein